MRSNIFKVVFVLVLAGGGVLLSGRNAAAEPGDGPRELVGTWRVQVTLVDCGSGTPLAPPFSSLVTFAAGGTMAEDTMNPGFGVGQRSAGQGTWNYQGRHTYGAKSVAYLNYTTPPNPATHNPGFHLGEQTISQTVRFNKDADTWDSTAAIAFIDGTDPGTAPYRTGCAVASAQRF